MKKIMIMAVAALVGVAASAASINWTMSNAYVPGSTDTRIATGAGQVYLFCAQDVTTAEIASLLGDSGTTLASKVSAITSKSIGNSAMTGSGRVSTSTAWDKAAGEYSFFGLILQDSALAEGGKYVLTAVTSSYGWDNAADAIVALGNQKDLTQNASNWSSVGKYATSDDPGSGAIPEPTSGLLLVLGVAGLALRRRRA